MFFSQFRYQRPINLHSLECDAETRCERSSYTFSYCAAFLIIQLEFTHPSGRAVSAVGLAQVKTLNEISESVKGPEILEELNNH